MNENEENVGSKSITDKQDEKGKNPFENNMKLFLVPSSILYILVGIYFRFDWFISIGLFVEFFMKYKFLKTFDVGFGNYQLIQGLRKKSAEL